MLLNCNYTQLANFEHFKTCWGGGGLFCGHSVMLSCGNMNVKTVTYRLQHGLQLIVRV